MANPREVIDELLKMHDVQARAIARLPTGVTPGYHAALGATITEDGRVSYVAPAATGIEIIRPSLAHVGVVNTCTVGDLTRVAFTSVDYDPRSQIDFSDLDGTGWNLSRLAYGDYDPDRDPPVYFNIGARVLFQTPESGEAYEPGDILELWLYVYTLADPTPAPAALLDSMLIQSDLSLFSYSVLLHGSAVVPLQTASDVRYFVAVQNDSRFDRVINGVAAPWASAFWALPIE